MPANQDQFLCDSSESDEGFGLDASFVEFLPFVERTKTFNDMVHPHLELPSICAKIINTPQFQRLRNLKQLGLCYYVYPSASHNRFEHCVGTSYLAGKYAKILKKNQPELNITDEDILCLYIAGLCHDIGHGPFSHTWERFMHETGNTKYCHEEMSLKMLDYLIEDNGLDEQFKAENLSQNDLCFIKELILGHPLPDNDEFIGRKPCKYFLYQIVSNERTKIDVDKFDYLLRDCKQLNVTTSFDYQRLIENSRVVGYKNETVCDITEDTIPTTIVYRKKIKNTIEDLFRSRFSMHQKAYQHRVTKVIEEMVLDGLKAAAAHFKVSGKDGTEYSLSTAYKDPSAFMKLTDSLLELFVNLEYGGKKATAILKRVICRRLYHFLGCFSGEPEKKYIDELLQNPKIRLIKTKINYGSGKMNPLNEILFYEKARPSNVFKMSFPDAPEERRTFIVLCPNPAETCTESEASFENDIEEIIDLEAARKEVKNWADNCGITLEYE